MLKKIAEKKKKFGEDTFLNQEQVYDISSRNHNENSNHNQ